MPDRRRWIYATLDAILAITLAVALARVIPASRHASATVHLWTLPLATLALAVGSALGGPRGWWVAVGAGSVVLLAAFGVIVRVIVSAAFLAGVYGAFGKAAAAFSLLVVLLVIELVVLVPLFHVRYLMSRAGRRAFGR